MSAAAVYTKKGTSAFEFHLRQVTPVIYQKPRLGDYITDQMIMEWTTNEYLIPSNYRTFHVIMNSLRIKL